MQDILLLARQATTDAKECTQTYMTERMEEAGAARRKRDAPEMVKLERAYGGCLGAKSR